MKLILIVQAEKNFLGEKQGTKFETIMVEVF